MRREEAILIRKLIEKAAAEGLSDAEALQCVELTEAWEPRMEYPASKRLRYEDDLYKTRQAHTSQADWPPDIAASLYERIPKPGEGDSPDKPIPYRGNMRIELGKYYEQYGAVYVGIADSINAVHNDLKDLVGLYVEEVGEA